LSEDALSAAIDGSADERVYAHLAQCPACQARLEAARATEQALRSRLHRFDCPSSQELADYHLGMLGIVDAARDRAIIRHLEQCVACTAEIAALRSFLDEAPAPAAQAPVVATQPRASLGDVFARLLPRAPQMALRGAASATISAEVDDVTILLDPQPGSQGLLLHGQLLSLDQERFDGALVTVQAGEALLAEGAVDDMGSFSVGPLAVAVVDVRIAPSEGPAIWVKGVELS
jgi:hypothetical protein